MKKVILSKLIAVLVVVGSVIGWASPALAISINGSAVSGSPCYVFFSGQVIYGRETPSTGVTILFLPPGEPEINVSHVSIDSTPLPNGSATVTKSFQWAGIIPGYEQKIPAGSKIRVVTNRQAAMTTNVAACG